MAFPVHPISEDGVTTSNLEDMVAPPTFQRNLVSGCTGPDTEIDRTSEFHDGQPERSLRISNTTSGGASIWICPSATAGAEWSISMGRHTTPMAVS